MGTIEKGTERVKHKRDNADNKTAKPPAHTRLPTPTTLSQGCKSVSLHRSLPDQVVLGDMLGGLGQELYFLNTTTLCRNKELRNTFYQPFNWHKVIHLPYWWMSARRKIMPNQTANLTRM